MGASGSKKTNWYSNEDCVKLSTIADQGDLIEIRHPPGHVRWGVFVGYNPAINQRDCVVYVTILELDHGPDKRILNPEPIVHCQPLAVILAEFPSSAWRVHNELDGERTPDAKQDIVQRAFTSRQMGYHATRLNNEAFAVWCRYGDRGTLVKCLIVCCSHLWEACSVVGKCLWYSCSGLCNCLKYLTSGREHTPGHDYDLLEDEHQEV